MKVLNTETHWEVHCKGTRAHRPIVDSYEEAEKEAQDWVNRGGVITCLVQVQRTKVKFKGKKA